MSTVNTAKIPITPNRRILLVDDNASILEDFQKVLDFADTSELDQYSRRLFGSTSDTDLNDTKSDSSKTRAEQLPRPIFEIDAALSGEEGYCKAVERQKAGEPYAMAFVDMRMPLGWDGVETVKKLWSTDPHMQIVICTAYSDYSWEELIQGLEHQDNLLLLKKPFEPIEVCQLSLSLTEKWSMSRIARMRLKEVEDLVEAKTAEVIAANQHKSRFLNIIGHEFLTPLNGVLGFAQIIRTEYGDRLQDRVLDYLEYIEVSGEKLHSLISDLLDVVNNASGKLAIQPEPVPPSELVDHALRGFAKQSSTHVVTFRSNKISQPVMADRKRCDQIILNLLTNAQKHSPPDEPIEINLSLKDNSVLFEILDQGPGINEKKLKSVFKLFQNTYDEDNEKSDSIKTSDEGFGLGLALAKHLVEAQEGELGIDSSVSKGTCVWFTLPLAK